MLGVNVESCRVQQHRLYWQTSSDSVQSCCPPTIGYDGAFFLKSIIQQEVILDSERSERARMNII
jgi:hypothetical protein